MVNSDWWSKKRQGKLTLHDIAVPRPPQPGDDSLSFEDFREELAAMERDGLLSGEDGSSNYLDWLKRRTDSLGPYPWLGEGNQGDS